MEAFTSCTDAKTESGRGSYAPISRSDTGADTDNILASLLQANSRELIYVLEQIALLRPAQMQEAQRSAAHSPVEHLKAKFDRSGTLRKPLERVLPNANGTPGGASRQLEIAVGRSEEAEGRKEAAADFAYRQLNSVDSNGTTPVVQFSTNTYFSLEDDGSIKITISRIGDLAKRSCVNIKTRDLSALAGVSYLGFDKRVIFAPGENEHIIEIDLLDREFWDTTLEFRVELYGGGDLGDLENGILGRYLWSARVKIIDTDFFPSNAYEHLVKDKQYHTAQVGLFWEYVKFNFRDPIVRSRSLKAMVVDQLHNIWAFLQLFLSVYMIDYILNHNSPNGRLILFSGKSNSLMAIVVLQIVPFLALHMLDHRKATLYGVGGTSRARLQVALLRKFLNYDADTRQELRNGDLIMAITRDSSVMVSEGYVNVLNLCAELGNLLLMLVYQFAAPVVFHKPFTFMGLVPIFLFPVLMVAFFWQRSELTSSLLAKKDALLDDLVSTVDDTVSNYRLIADYSQRTKFVGRFDSDVKLFNSANKNTRIVLKNNRYFPKYVATLFVLVWTIYGGTRVINGQQSLGLFMANISILNKIGTSWDAIYRIVLEITTIFPAMENVIMAMNLRTDVMHRSMLSKQRLATTQHLLKQLQLEAENLPDPSRRVALDRMPIHVGNIRLNYNTKSPNGDNRVTSLNGQGVLQVQQGQLVCLVGPSGGGKATLLNVIGGEHLPDPVDLEEKSDAGTVFFVPSHLRVLQVSEPLFFDGTLFSNLSFGVAEGDQDGGMPRVTSICEKLGLLSHVIRHIQEKDSHEWCDVLSTTECQLLSLARALIANPEMLCIHKPTQVFNEEMSLNVTGVLKEFVMTQGLLEDANIFMTRPRTCVMTTSDRCNLTFADEVFHVSRENGIRRVAVTSDLNMSSPDPDHIIHAVTSDLHPASADDIEHHVS